MNIDNLPENIKNAIMQFIEPHCQTENTLGIVLAGSYAYGIPSKNSDVDIHIVVKESKERTRGNTWINGIEIEYFINPLQQIYAYFKAEEHDLRPTTIHMFAHGLIVYQQKGSTVLTDLMTQAKEMLGKPLPELTNQDKELDRYYLDDIVKDLEDATLLDNPIAYMLNASLALNASLKILLQIHRSRREKTKLLNQQLTNLDPEFANLYTTACTSIYKLEPLKLLVSYVETLLGGKRSKEWTFTSSLRLNS